MEEQNRMKGLMHLPVLLRLVVIAMACEIMLSYLTVIIVAFNITLTTDQNTIDILRAGKTLYIPSMLAICIYSFIEFITIIGIIKQKRWSILLLLLIFSLSLASLWYSKSSYINFGTLLTGSYLLITLIHFKKLK